MTLYLIYEQAYGNTEIIGIYDNKQNADIIVERLDRLAIKNKNDMFIQEIQLNSVTNDIKNELVDRLLEIKKDFFIGE